MCALASTINQRGGFANVSCLQFCHDGIAPLAALAPRNAVGGAVGGAVVGGVVGGPVGAAVGAGVGGTVGAATEEPPPPPVVTYVEREDVPSVAVQERVVDREPLPPTVVLRPVRNTPQLPLRGGEPAGGAASSRAPARW